MRTFFIKLISVRNAIFLPIIIFSSTFLIAQTYPDPEFSNQVYCLKKDGTPSLVQLEKKYAKEETKVKFGGFSGTEYGYTIPGERSTVRLNKSSNLSFIYSTGASSNSKADSIRRTNGIGQTSLAGMGMDLSTMVNLYKVNPEKNNRKIYLVKNKGVFGGKNKGSDKFTFSIKKVREGYWEFVPDQSLTSGEYCFVVRDFNTDGSHTLFSFGVE